jgi:peptide deformylase
MTLLRIRIWPDSDLRMVAAPVTDFGPDFQRIVDDMAETMYANRGAGLAATQVGIPLRVFVMDTTENQSKLEVLVNHEVAETSGKLVLMPDEGCLSFPGIIESIPRYEWVKAAAWTRHGEPFVERYEGLAAQCVQHEGEHLNGKVMIDHLSRTKRRFIEKVLRNRRTRSK